MAAKKFLTRELADIAEQAAARSVGRQHPTVRGPAEQDARRRAQPGPSDHLFHQAGLERVGYVTAVDEEDRPT